MKISHPFIIGIAGGTGAGKTTLVKEITDKLHSRSVLTIQHDSYYRDISHLSQLEREKVNFDHPDSLETDLLVKHLEQLIKGEKVEIPEYDFVTHTRQEKGNIVESARLIIVEGHLLFTNRKLRELFNLKIFIDADDDIRFIRRLQRDIKERGRSTESVIQQYFETVKPMHKEFVEISKRYTDIILPGEQSLTAINMLITMLNTELFN